MDEFQRTRICLAVILLFAAALRFYGLDWSTDSRTGTFHRFHPDEATLLHNAVTVGKPFEDAHTAYGRVPAYTLYVVATIGGAWAGIDPFDLDDNAVAGFTFVLARATSALLSTLTVLVVFGIGRRLHSDLFGLCAAACLAFTPGAVQQAHYFTADSALAFWSTLGLYTILRLPSARRRDYVACGLAVGLAAGTRLLAGLLVLPYLLAHLVPADDDARPVSDRLRGAFRPDGLICAAIVLTITVASEPLLLLDFDAFHGMDDMRNFMPSVKVASGEWTEIWTLYDHNTTPWIFYVTHLLRWAMGILPEIAAIAGLIWALTRGDRHVWILAAWLLPYGFVVGGFFTKPIRYTTPMLPVLAVTATWFAFQVAARLPLPRRQVAIVLLAGLFLPSAAYAVAISRNYGKDDSRVVASRWIAENLEAGSQVLVEGGGFPTAWMADPKRFDVRQDLGTHYLLARGHVLESDQIRLLADNLETMDYWLLVEENRMRQYLSVPHQYPVAHQVFTRLRNGRLGLERVRTFSSPPTLFGLTFSEAGAEPTITGFDRPTVHVYRTTPDVSPFIEAWADSVAADPRRPDGAIAAGIEAFRAEIYAEARGHFRRAARIDPDLQLARVLEAQTLFAQGRGDEARAQFADLVPSWWDFAGMVYAGLREYGVRYLVRTLETGELEPFERAYIRLLCTRVSLELGYEDQQEGRMDEALRHYEQAVAVDSSNVYAMGNIASVFLQQDEPERAIDALRDALARAPENPRLWTALGMTFSHMDRLLEARDAALKAVELVPGESEGSALFMNLGGKLYAAGNMQAAESVFLEAVRRGIHLREAWFNLGAVWSRAGRPDRAVEAFERVLEIAPDDAQARAGLAKARDATGK